MFIGPVKYFALEGDKPEGAPVIADDTLVLVFTGFSAVLSIGKKGGLASAGQAHRNLCNGLFARSGVAIPSIGISLSFKNIFRSL